MIELKNKFECLFEKAQKAGISKRRIGVEMWGEKQYRNIYVVGVPAKRDYKMYDRIDRAINKIIADKKAKK